MTQNKEENHLIEERRKKLADLIDNSRVEIIDNCGHMMLLEEADRVLKVLKQFILEYYPAKKLN